MPHSPTRAPTAHGPHGPQGFGVGAFRAKLAVISRKLDDLSLSTVADLDYPPDWDQGFDRQGDFQ